MATFNVIGTGSGVSGSAGLAAVDAVGAALKPLLSRKSVVVDLNSATGSDSPGGVGITAAIADIRSGYLWVDYGQWPWGQYAPAVSTLGVTNIFEHGVLNRGFGGFLQEAGLFTPAAPATYLKSSGAAVNSLKTLLPGALPFSIIPSFQHEDPNSFDLDDWSFAVQLRPPYGTYPYPYGLVTTTKAGSSGNFIAMPGAPSITGAFGTKNGAPQRIYVYSAFALRIGTGWYFEAQQPVSPSDYAAFIAKTIGATTTNAQRQASLSSTPVGSTPAQAAAAGCLSSATVAKYGATNNGYVMAVQNALRQKGYNLGATGPNGNGVDGDFGPLTLAALNKWQGSKGVLNQNFGCGKVIVDKQMGPAVYKALGITAPASVGGSSAPPPASSGGSGGSGGGSGGGSKKGTTGHTVNPTGTWSGSGSTAKAYASVDGKNVLEKVPLAGGTLTIDGVVVTWGQAPGYSAGGGIFAGIFDDLAKALNTTPQNVELGAAGVVLLGVTLAVTQGGGKR